MQDPKPLEQDPHDPRVSCPGCQGTGYTDRAHTLPHDVCQGSGLITPARLTDLLTSGL